MTPHSSTRSPRLLQRPKTGAIALERVLQYLPLLEQSGNYALATKVCELIQAAYKDNPIAEIREYALERTDVALRRLNLLGKPLSVEGNLLNGSPLDFAPYQGKVVLLAFWSSMSPPCRPELLAVKSVYEKYHAKGFEVLGVSLDQDPAAAAQFLDELKLPWVTITNNKLAEQFGVEVIPYLVLTDAQGNVADLFLRGSSLEAKLAAMLGEAAANRHHATRGRASSPSGDGIVEGRPTGLLATQFCQALADGRTQRYRQPGIGPVSELHSSFKKRTGPRPMHAARSIAANWLS